MKTFKYIICALAAAVLAFSCTKEKEEYQATPAEKGSQVRFVQVETLPTYDDKAGVISLTGNEDGFFEIKLVRENADKMVLVQIDAEADEIFTVPSSVVFEKGAKEAALKIEFDPEDIEPQKSYPFSLSLSGQEVSQYAIANISFKAGDVLPLEWHKWKKGHMTEAWWGEEEDEDMYYAVLDGDNASKALFASLANEKDPITAFFAAWKDVRTESSFLDLYCYIENCFDTMGDADPTNYYFTWHLKDNFIIIAQQYMGYTHSTYGPVYFSDIIGYAMAKGGFDEATAIAWATSNGYLGERAYYDGNGGFYLAQEYFVGAGSFTAPGPDVFIAEGFVRTVDYNPSAEVYEYRDFAVGTVDSEGFEDSWDDQPLQINEYALDGKAIYYLPDYFGEDLGLAFAGPLHGEIYDGASISGLANEQATGGEYGGKPLYARVIGGKISLDEDGLPTFRIKIQYETYAPSEDDPEVMVLYGTLPVVEEVFTASEVVEFYSDYQIEPLSNKRDYFGKYNATIYSAASGPIEVEVTVSEGGATADRTTQLVAFSGLYPGYDLAFEYDKGYLTLAGFIPTAVYRGAYYLGAAPVDATLVGGIYTNPKTNAKKLVIVASESNFDGFYVALANPATYQLVNALDIIYDFVADYTGHEAITEEDDTPAPAAFGYKSYPSNSVELPAEMSRKSLKTPSHSCNFALTFPERCSRDTGIKSISL